MPSILECGERLYRPGYAGDVKRWIYHFGTDTGQGSRFATGQPDWPITRLKADLVSRWRDQGQGERQLLSLLRGHRMKCLLRRMRNEPDFLSDYGARALLKIHERDPYRFKTNGNTMEVGDWPAESMSGLLGGNSNWRRPIWMPVNFFLIESLQKFHHYYGDDFKLECPTGPGTFMTINEVADELSRRLAKVFPNGEDGQRPVLKHHPRLATDPHFKDDVLFHEYFHGDNGRGVGVASNRLDWTSGGSEAAEANPLGLHPVCSR